MEYKNNKILLKIHQLQKEISENTYRKKGQDITDSDGASDYLPTLYLITFSDPLKQKNIEDLSRDIINLLLQAFGTEMIDKVLLKANYLRLPVLDMIHEHIDTPKNAALFLKELLSYDRSGERAEIEGNLSTILFNTISTKFGHSISNHLTDTEKQNFFIRTANTAVHSLIHDKLGFSYDCDGGESEFNAFLDAQVDTQGENSQKPSMSPESLLDYKYRNLDSKEGNYTKIPKTLHNIWLTSPDKPIQLRAQDIRNAIKNKNLFNDEDNESWAHILWTNSKDLIGPSVKKLINSGIEVREMSEIKEHLSNYDIVEQEINLKHWGIASDTLRYDIVNHMGGLYADINYEFAKAPNMESQTFDFFTATFDPKAYHFSIDNFMFGAKPNHPVIQETQNLVRENLLNPSPLMQELYKESIKDFTDKATADVFGYSYFTKAHEGDNLDVVYPYPYKSTEANAKDTEDDQLEYFEPFLHATKAFCDEAMQDRIAARLKEFSYFSEYLQEHEICAVEKHIIGYDSTDGLTWVSKNIS